MGYTGGVAAEGGGEKKPTPWKVSDAPESYVGLLKKNIIGIEIHIERLQGKFKMSQELGEGDRQGVVQGFEGLGSEVGHGMARTVRERGEMKKKT